MDRIAILKNGELKMLANNVETAIKLVQSLEATIDRNLYHSPFTLLPESALSKEQIRGAALLSNWKD